MKNEKGLFVKNPNKFRLPRKIKKKIPFNTHYCYKATSEFKVLKDGRYGFTVKPCKFYSYIKLESTESYKEMILDTELFSEKEIEEIKSCKDKKVPWCEFVRSTVEDQCKICGIGY